jgi:hypothetical protein
VVAVAGKDGYLHAFARDGGAKLWASTTTTLLNDTVAPTPAGVRFCPGVQGGAEWNGPAYDAASGTLVVGTVDWCTTVWTTPPGRLEGKTGVPWTGSARLVEPFGRMDPRRDGARLGRGVRRGHGAAAVALPRAGAGGRRGDGHRRRPHLHGRPGGDDLRVRHAHRRRAVDARRRDAGGRRGGDLRGGGAAVRGRGRGAARPVTWKVSSPKARMLVFALP